MPTLDLRPKWLETVRYLAARYTPDAEVFAYGSRVNGTAHDGSDLDLCVRNPDDPDRPVYGVDALREAFSESNLPILVDLLDWAILPESFRREILKSDTFLIQPDGSKDRCSP
ncbi:nucleotidyltransferase family protein [Geomesophilobacter sediminis]|uniref:Nucleotidyltransferase domain-containing protein n=1 Tax=Geomesophilobacter sediminis TaxID=2798584 RepID=A0A8J7SC42_9BACT|nr:nucleotidyltransferase domain-containing protein [Geomesophilobacter sediminis]MBJ6726809.1 nucleotidyltransferase domain-containing protein [Geomesophilobacter sediminis]